MCVVLFCVFCLRVIYDEGMKVVFITGGATGIGRAAVQKFHNEGYAVAFVDTNAALAEVLLDDLGRERLLFVEADVRNASAIEAAVEQTLKRFERLDVVFPNAGVHASNTLLSSTEADWDNLIDINVKGVLRTLKATVPHLTQGSAIVLMASDQALMAKKNNFVYGLTKGAIGQMTKSLALDLAAQGVRVNAVCPGTVRTPLAEAAIERWANRDFAGDTQKAWQLEAQEIPLGKVASAQEVASVVYFLASSAASHMTGTLIPIDGGSSV